MAQVPYQPFSTAQPDLAGTPQINLNVPREAFGAGVARAIEGVGGSLEHVADQYVNTSMEFKRLDLESSANQAITDNLVARGKLDNDFRQLQGQDAQNKLEAHVQALQTARESRRALLGTDYEKKLYDQGTTRQFGYDVVNAGNYAATQLKQYTSQTRKANQIAIGGSLVQDPNNDAAIDAGVKAIVGLELRDAHADGQVDPEVLTKPTKIDDLSPIAQERVRGVIARSITSIAKERANRDPDGASALVERYKDMLGPKYLAVKEDVDKRGNETRATSEAARIVGPDPSLLDIRKAGSGVRTEQLSPEFRPRATAAIAAAEAATGEKAVIESAKRTTAEQTVLRQRYLSGQGGLAAPPGTSLHETGDALDIKDGPVLNKLREWYKSGELEKNYGVTMLSDAANDPGHMQIATGGGYQRPARSPQALTDMRGAADDSANTLAKKYNWDTNQKQEYLDNLNRNITNRVNVQQRDLSIRTKALHDVVTSTLNQTLPNGQSPVNADEASQLNPDFRDQLDQLLRLNPDFKRTLDAHYTANGKGEAHETDAHTSARTTAQINRMMRDPDFSPEAIQSAIIEARARDPGQPGSLNRADYKDLITTLADVKTPQGMERKSERDEFLKRYAPTIDPSMGNPQSDYFGRHTALGLQKMYEVEKVLKSEEKRLGTDWRQLYDPGSKDFFGRPENLMKYRATMQDAAAYQATLGRQQAVPPPPVPARNQAQAAEARTNIVDVPAEMSPTEALTKFGPGPVRLPNGRIKDLR